MYTPCTPGGTVFPEPREVDRSDGMRHDSNARAPRALPALAALLVFSTAAAPQDPPAGSWAGEASGDGFSQGATATDGTYLYVMAGMQFGSVSGFPGMFQQLRRYDPASDTWTTLAPLPLAVSDNAGT